MKDGFAEMGEQEDFRYKPIGHVKSVFQGMTSFLLSTTKIRFIGLIWRRKIWYPSPIRAVQACTCQVDVFASVNDYDFMAPSLCLEGRIQSFKSHIQTLVILFHFFSCLSLTVNRAHFNNPDHSLLGLEGFSHVWLLWVTLSLIFKSDMHDVASGNMCC